MLDFIRTRSGGIVSIVIVGAIALVFVFWGVGGQNTGDAINIRIDGESYPITSFLEARKNVQDGLRGETRGLSPNSLELIASQRALANLVQRHILNSLARDTGRMVPAEAVAKFIKSDPAFEENGRFSKDLYEKTVLNRYGMNLPVFEGRVRERILLSDAESFVQNLSFSPTEALREQYHLSLDQISLNYVFFPASAWEDELTPSETELESFYNERKEDYRRPAEAKVEYVTFNPDDYLSEARINEADLEELYLEERESLTTPPQAEISSILVSFPNFDPSPEEKKAAYEKALMIYLRAQNEDFAALAKEVSDDPQTAESGGKLPPISKGQGLPEIDQALFGASPPKAGDVLQPIETLFGYQIIKTDSFSPEKVRSMEDARQALTETLRKRAARKAATNRLEDLLEAAQNQPGTDLKALAGTLGLFSFTSDFFSAENPPAFLGSSPSEAEKAVAQPIGLISEPVDSPLLLTLYVPLERRESYVPELKDPLVTEAVQRDWIKAESLKKSEEAALAFIDSLKETSFVSAAKALKEGSPELGSTPLSPRREILSAPEPISLSDLSILIKTVFGFSRVGESSSLPIPVSSGDKKGYLLLSLRDFKAADDLEFEASLREWRDNFGPNAASEAYSLWITSRTGEIKLTIPPELQAELNRLGENALL
jgi:peptidyl-prolyl cis-trans isomerase D